MAFFSKNTLICTGLMNCANEEVLNYSLEKVQTYEVHYTTCYLLRFALIYNKTWNALSHYQLSI